MNKFVKKHIENIIVQFCYNNDSYSHNIILMIKESSKPNYNSPSLQTAKNVQIFNCHHISKFNKQQNSLYYFPRSELLTANSQYKTQFKSKNPFLGSGKKSQLKIASKQQKQNLRPNNFVNSFQSYEPLHTPRQCQNSNNQLRQVRQHQNDLFFKKQNKMAFITQEDNTTQVLTFSSCKKVAKHLAQHMKSINNSNFQSGNKFAHFQGIRAFRQLFSD